MATSTIQNNQYKFLASKTSTGETDRLDITDYVNSYAELVVVVYYGNSSRISASLALPTAYIKTLSSGNTLYFETGAYASSSAYGGDRLVLINSSGEYKLSGGWSIREGVQRNLSFDVYGR